MFCANASLVDLQYDSLDPLSLGNGDANYQRNTMGEWDSVCDVRGYGGFRSFKVRPKKLSRHGRQYVRYDNEEEPLFNMSNVSRLKSQSIRHSTAACRGDEREPVWTITADMMERTQVVLNEKEEQVAFVQKSLKTLILNAQFGKGSEVVIDIAPGVDQFGTLADAPVVARAGCSLGLAGTRHGLACRLVRGILCAHVLGLGGGRVRLLPCAGCLTFPGPPPLTLFRVRLVSFATALVHCRLSFLPFHSPQHYSPSSLRKSRSARTLSRTGCPTLSSTRCKTRPPTRPWRRSAWAKPSMRTTA